MKKVTRRQALFTASIAIVPCSQPASAGWLETAQEAIGMGKGTLRVLLLDVSSSPASHADHLYQQAAKAFFKKTEVGDALVLSTAGSAGLDALQIAHFYAQPATTELKSKLGLRKTVKEAEDWLAGHLARPKENKSRILEALAGLRPSVLAAKRKGMKLEILACTDGVESSGLANFETSAGPSAAEQKTLLKTLMTKGLLVSAKTEMPTGRFYLCGAGGLTPSSYLAIKEFWASYSDLCGLELSHYGQSLPPF
jgi:hypothetical protein